MKKIYIPFLVVLCFCLLLTNYRSLGNDHKGLIYIYPGTESEMVLPQTNIIFRLANQAMVSNETLANLIAVEGSENGKYKGEIYLSDDHQTYIFQPDRPFIP